MCTDENLIKYHCDACGLDFWVKVMDEPRFCPFCERAIISDNKQG